LHSAAHGDILATGGNPHEAAISTASSTLSHQGGDSIETVDRQGQLSLIAAARAAGTKHFAFVSIPRNPVCDSPLTRAKAEAERALANSGMGYTILACNYFMEIWLSPALGFDYAQRKVVIFGDGRAPIAWVSYRDVAELAVRSHLTPGARNQILEVGGPQDLSPLEVVGIFEKAAGAPLERQLCPSKLCSRNSITRLIRWPRPLPSCNSSMRMVAT
jgi:uncharacterized protein YbjT (DUF2867 family)